MRYRYIKTEHDKWDKVFKIGLSKFCGRQPLKNLKGSRSYPFKFLKGYLPQNLLSLLLNTLSQIACINMENEFKSDLKSDKLTKL